MIQASSLHVKIPLKLLTNVVVLKKFGCTKDVNVEAFSVSFFLLALVIYFWEDCKESFWEGYNNTARWFSEDK